MSEEVPTIPTLEELIKGEPGSAAALAESVKESEAIQWRSDIIAAIDEVFKERGITIPDQTHGHQPQRLSQT